MAFNPNIHHRRSIRLKGYDYSQAGLYFITICTHNRKCLFGKIVGVENSLQKIESPPKMILNDAGKIANECWLEIPKHFPNVVLHEHVVMPNHIHGIIELSDVADVDVGVEHFQPLHQNTPPPSIMVEHVQPTQNTPPPSIWDENIEPPHQNNNTKRNEFQKMIPRSIGSIVKGFKIGVTKWFRTNTDIETIWQRNYHEHIIRNEQSYHTISNYIINNPANWKEDKFYK